MKRALIIFAILLLFTFVIPFAAVVRQSQSPPQKPTEMLAVETAAITVQGP